MAINPWYTATLDLLIGFSLLRWRPKGQERVLAIGPRQFRTRAMGVLVMWLSVGVPTAFAMGSFRDTAGGLSAAGIVSGDGEIVVLEPETWIGKRFPLLKYIDIGDRLDEGRWVVVLYHHDCQSCQEALPTYRRLAAELARQPAVASFALIEIPPYGPMEGMGPLRHVCQNGRVTDSHRWFVQTPTILALDDGIVLEGRDEVEAASWIGPWAMSRREVVR